MAVNAARIQESEALSVALGQRIHQLRLQRCWTQLQLSKAADGLYVGYISRIESGKVECCLGTIAILSKAFGLTLAELLQGI